MGTRVMSFLGNVSSPATRIARRAEMHAQAPRVKSPRSCGPQRNNKEKSGLTNQKGKIHKMCCFRCVSRRKSLRTHMSKNKAFAGVRRSPKLWDVLSCADRNPRWTVTADLARTGTGNSLKSRQ
ncbi:hypothetical protein NDU88_002138 [Pleurodeles waltl]|uniref:Uncharacterized protein n=1 Tax=Pleurodeles waltl TaxID=8319 RepID=A0AAV7VCZ2_PLEWA|nr:hypothetical protein NDU88_002138 [Pleurodeles waltl]